MGYMIELNTLLRPPQDFDFNSLAVGKKYLITLDRERAFPLHIAICLIDKDWNFYGYCVTHSVLIQGKKTKIEFEMLTLFSPEEKKLYREKFIEAGKMTGEVT